MSWSIFINNLLSLRRIMMIKIYLHTKLRNRVRVWLVCMRMWTLSRVKRDHIFLNMLLSHDHYKYVTVVCSTKYCTKSGGLKRLTCVKVLRSNDKAGKNIWTRWNDQFLVFWGRRSYTSHTIGIHHRVIFDKLIESGIFHTKITKCSLDIGKNLTRVVILRTDILTLKMLQKIRNWKIFTNECILLRSYVTTSSSVIPENCDRRMIFDWSTPKTWAKLAWESSKVTSPW